MDLDDALARARAGDEEGFAVLWRCYQPRLLRFLQVYSGHDVDDLASETWLQVVRDLSRFRGDATAFAAWLFTVARRRAIDAQRARSRRPAVLADTPPEDEGATPTAEEVALEQLSTRAALALVARLPRRQAEAIALNILVGLDANATARVLHTTPGAVRVRVHRGMRGLASMLTSTGERVPT